jgi:hypothetical protein
MVSTIRNMGFMGTNSERRWYNIKARISNKESMVQRLKLVGKQNFDDADELEVNIFNV